MTYKITVVTLLVVFLLSVLSLFGNHLFLELTTHFRLQYLIAGLVCAGALLICQQWRLLPLAILVVLFNAAFVKPYYDAPKPLAGSSGVGVRLLQVNLLKINRSYEKAIAAIRDADADVVVLQELTPQWEQQVQVLTRQYPYCEWAARPSGSGMAILSRRPLGETRVLKLDPSTSHVAILTRVEIGPRSLTVLGLHPTTPITPKKFVARNRQFEEAAAILSSVTGPKVLIGDLNTSMWSPYFTQLAQQSGLRDARLGFGLRTSWPMPLPSLLRLPIDHCLVSKDVRVDDVRLGKRTGSDHRPVIFDLQVE
jgi:endonuclease/exonuclease/phosphatase (EEP) superfamily protein YafD